jgi:hypothetical protein
MPFCRIRDFQLKKYPTNERRVRYGEPSQKISIDKKDEIISWTMPKPETFQYDTRLIDC